ncbi:DUF6933 domain-containing protein [Dyella flava]|uniref:DUF6933 domain-containing protein n=1 Tax=Dyella flava TaxID=1920170 RepID=A0ABS2K042_9GAMM|nr:hypothetical protein [Dyella flava]MBM7124501.1 hypothetical protein [Dyella flava]GLQ51833.1 hypothetical protein GCM10010872_32820 [Dyella flava]
MIALRCTTKLLKRLHQSAKLPAPPVPTNPLGEWYADLDFFERKPFLTLLNASTGAGLVLPGNAEFLKYLHIHAGQQLFKLLLHYDFDPEWPQCSAELAAWEAPPIYANTSDRSLLGSMNRFKLEAWHRFADGNRSLPEVAASWWEGIFSHPALPKSHHGSGHYHRPLDLVLDKLAPPGTMLIDYGRR